jgi:hypothetical protein
MSDRDSSLELRVYSPAGWLRGRLARVRSAHQTAFDSRDSRDELFVELMPETRATITGSSVRCNGERAGLISRERSTREEKLTARRAFRQKRVHASARAFNE